MNLELLKKLTRLANNNPNDNEANLAARRVCKMLEADNWKFDNSRPEQPKTWNDVKRSEAPQWKSAQKEPSGDPFGDWYKKYREAYEDPFNRPGFSSRKPGFTYAEDFMNYRPTKEERKEARKENFKYTHKCTKCGQDGQSRDEVVEDFICNICYWKDRL